MKKKGMFAVILAALLLANVFSLGACKPRAKPHVPPEQQKPILLFLIDEGVRNLELLGTYAEDFDALHASLDRVFAAAAPLKAQYEVRWLLYCHHHYREEGFGTGDPSVPLNRVSPVLKETFAYMERKGEKMMLEQYSSGVFTHQIAKPEQTVLEPRVPQVPVRYGDSERVYGISMDAEALGALAEEYDSFAGIRFHELIGTSTIFPDAVSTRAIIAAVDFCADNGLQLAWGDHSWDVLYTLPEVEEWKARLRYAREKLGEDLILNYSNNSWDCVKSLNMEPMLQDADYEGANFGYSVQAWFWQENDVAGLNTAARPKWYTAAYQDMPVELMAAFTLKGVEKGARMIQFEPMNYFFNWWLSGNNPQDESFTENGADYSGRITLARFIDLVTREDPPFTDPAAFYTTRESQLDANREEDKPKKYNQTTLGVLGDKNLFYDVYNDDKTNLREDSAYRFLPAVTDGEIIGAARMNLTFGCRDELVVFRRGAAGAQANFYAYNSTPIAADDVTFADNERGAVTDFFAANLIEKKVASLEGDPDELIVRRETKDGAFVYELYEIVSASNSARLYPFSLRYVRDLDLDSERAEGYRVRNALRSDETRAEDFAGAFTIAGDKLGVRLNLKIQTAEISIETQIDCGGEIVDFVTADVNLDIEDDLVVLVRENDGGYRLRCFTRKGSEFAEAEQYGRKLPTGTYKSLFSLRTTTYYNKALLY